MGAAATTTEGVSRSHRAAERLAQMSNELHGLVARFRL
jgi:methyl-accepting chemotaxis protein